MSTCYDGKQLVRVPAQEPVLEVRGKYLFSPKFAAQPMYEICGRYIYEYMHAGQPEFLIDDDDRVFALSDRTQPRFELR